ncbi:MAG: RIP metalloprotease RseP [Bacteroidales bacterium]
MSVIIQIAQFLLSLSILVFLHELGHFAFAKLFRTRVEKFYIFFNPWFSLFKKKIGDTEYGIGWLPLGGYVKISGMIDESMDKEQMKKPPQPWEFRSKPSYQRLLIMVGGVLVNFLLALFIYSTTLYVWGEQYLPTKNVKYGIMCDSVALDIGLRNGDKILTVDHVEIENFNKIFHDVVVNSARSIQVERDGQEVDIPILAEHIAPLLKSEVFIATRIPFIVDDFSKDSPARTAGILVNDKVVALNDMEIEFFDEFRTQMSDLKGQEIAVRVLRGGESITYTFKATDDGKIGVWPVGDLSRFFELQEVEYSFFQAIPAGISKGFGNAISYLKQLRLIFTPKTKAYESLGGFIKIGSFFPKVWNWQIFWEMTALLSIILAIMNLLPIPALDGGHVMFLLYEIVSGRKPGDKFMEYAQIAGMLLLLALLLYANGNDVVQLFRK